MAQYVEKASGPSDEGSSVSTDVDDQGAVTATEEVEEAVRDEEERRVVVLAQVHTLLRQLDERRRGK